MTRLTKDLRSKILDSILAATKYPALEETYMKLCRASATAWAKSKLPKEWESKTKGLPREWFATCSQIAMSGYHPGRITKMRYTYSIEIEAFAAPMTMSCPKIDDSDPPTWFFELRKETDKVRDEYFTLRSTINGTLNSYTTVEKLLKDFPEFSRHVPNQPTHYPISTNVTEVVKVLMGAGFDTGVKPEVGTKPRGRKVIK